VVELALDAARLISNGLINSWYPTLPASQSSITMETETQAQKAARYYWWNWQRFLVRLYKVLRFVETG
jgi:hypothetical protein